MISAVFLTLVLLSPTFSLPLSSQEYTTSGYQTPQTVGNYGVINPQGTVTEQKTGVIGGVPVGVTQNVEKIQTQGFSGVEQTPQVGAQVHPGTPTQYSESGSVSQGEKTAVQHPSESFTSHKSSENYPSVVKGENEPTNFGHKGPVQTESLHLPTFQVSPVVPVNQISEFVQPVVVPAEAVTTGRMIIMTIEPIQQRNFQDVVTVSEGQVPVQKVVQPVPYSTVQTQGVAEPNQPYTVQPVEKYEIQTGGQIYNPVQGHHNPVPYVNEQRLQQPVEPVQNNNPVTTVVSTPQVYNVQPSVQPIVGQYVEKQATEQYNHHTQGETQYVEPAVSQPQTYTGQYTPEKQGFQQVNSYEPSQNQEVGLSYQQQKYSVGVENVQSFQPHQQNEGYFQKQTVEPNHQKQQVYTDQNPVEKQTFFQQTSNCASVQNQPLVQQVSALEPENYQNQQVPVEPNPVQQVFNVQPEYIQTYTPNQPESVVQVENVHEVVEKQIPHQQPIESNQNSNVHSEVVNQQQKVSEFQPFAATQPETTYPNQPVQPESSVYVPQEVHVKSPVQTNQQVYVAAEPQEHVNYSENPVYNFGDKIQQNTPVHVLSVSPQYQGQLVNPSAVTSQT